MAGGSSLSFSWHISREGQPILNRHTAACSFRTSLPHDGVYDVTMEVVSSGGSRETLAAAINVRDIVIVSFGDSAASGEGNPDDAGTSTTNGWTGGVIGVEVLGMHLPQKP